MVIYYLIPIIFIIAIVAVTSVMRKKIFAKVAAMTPEQAAEAMHNFYSRYFKLKDGEKIVGTWSGLDYTKPKSAAGQAASSVLNAASGALIGVSSYIPNVQIGLTSNGRVLISREHSEFGERGHYKQILALGKRTKAVDGSSAYPGADLGIAPKNPFNQNCPLEFVHLQSPKGTFFDAWVSPQGAKEHESGFISILRVLGEKD